MWPQRQAVSLRDSTLIYTGYFEVFSLSITTCYNCWKCRSSLTCIDNEIFSSQCGQWMLVLLVLPFQIPTHQGKSCVQNAPPNVFVEGKIRDHDFLHIAQALKPRPCSPFIEPFSHESELFNTLSTSIFKNTTLVFGVPLKRLDTSGSSSPPSGYRRQWNVHGSWSFQNDLCITRQLSIMIIFCFSIS